MNQVTLLGRLTRDPEMKFAQGNGMAITRFSIAVNRKMKKGEADFINCVAFGKTGEAIAQYVTKGNRLLVNGSIQTGSYENKEGIRVNTTDIIVNNFEFIEKSENRGQDNNSFGDMEMDNSGDIPF